MSNSNQIVFHSVISSIQKVALYESKTKLHLVGSNDQETKFRVLDIDRTHPNELRINENPCEMDSRDLRKLVTTWGYCKKISAYGILGFVRFLEGYYLILVTKRTRRAVIGMHLVYTIEDTAMVRVNEPSSKQPHPLEQRYLKMFQNIDLNSNFYFSYSYDLTRTLQYNQSPPKFVGADADIEHDQPLPDWHAKNADPRENIEYAFRSTSRKRFVWNAFLLRPMESVMQRDWMLEVIHGFISQSNISIFGRPVYVCLIARRSTRFAGTRYLKRGANFMGDVANEVETEQIAIDGHRLSSFVQMRGSIPLHWSQDNSKIVPKPQIQLDLPDPYSLTPGKHFARLLFQFGSPIIILNLVKKHEKRKHESILTRAVKQSVHYLNQFLPPQHRLKYVHFDMARKSRGGGNIMAKLASIAEDVVQQTGLFLKDPAEPETILQTGLVRVNCVDCLDRTNTAQFAIGKCALAHQLFRMGLLRPPHLDFDSDCITMLESLYEDHGDTLALQYGGSQLVHRIKTYRKTAAWTSQGNDIMQTMSRYLRNTFSDTEKQHSINLFLGYYIPYENSSKDNAAIWELTSDYYMHNIQSFGDSQSLVPITQWVPPIVMRHLPYSTCDANKIVKELIRVHSKDLEMIDFYSNYHLPYKWTPFEEHIAYQISHMARNFMQKYRTSYSPFQPEPGSHRGSSNNPSMTGQSSTSSLYSSSSSSGGEDSMSDDDTLTEKKATTERLPLVIKPRTKVQFNHVFPAMQENYGSAIIQPTGKDLLKYMKYVQFGKLATPSANGNAITSRSSSKSPNLGPMSDYGFDCYEQVEPPQVDDASMFTYKRYVNVLDSFETNPMPKDDLSLIENFVKMSEVDTSEEFND